MKLQQEHKTLNPFYADIVANVYLKLMYSVILTVLKVSEKP
jgi:hypothetical protein